MTLTELRKALKKLGVTVPEVRRAIFFLTHLERAYAFFHVDLPAKLGVQDTRFVWNALFSSNLMDELAEVLDYYASALVASQLQKYGRNKNRNDVSFYSKFFDETYFGLPNVGNVEKVLHDCELLSHALEQNTTNFLNNIEVACRRIIADKLRIERYFGDIMPSRRIAQLSKIKSTGSDFHKGGKQVLILTFDVTTSYSSTEEFRLIYKPSDIEIDCLIAGNSRVANDCIPGFNLPRSLFEIINEELAALEQESPAAYVRYLSTYRIYPVRYSSTHNTQNNPDIPIRECYGYIEYLNNDVTGVYASWFGKKTGYYPGLVSDFLIFKSQDAEEIAHTFHHLQGILIAIACTFSLTDLHMENVRVRKYRPHLIDLENSLLERIDTVTKTHLLHYNMGGFNHHLNTDPARKWQVAWDKTAGKYDLSLSTPPGNFYSENRLWKMVSGKEQLVHLDPDTIIAGFNRGMDIIEKCHNAGKFDPWFARLDNVLVRCVAYPTKFFREFRASVYHNPYMYSKDYKIKCDETLNTVINDKLLGEYNAYVEQKKTSPDFLVLQSDVVYQDLYDLDIPVFYHRLKSRALYDSRGREISIPAAITINNVVHNLNINRTTFYARSPFEVIKQEQIDLCDEPEPWVYRQNDLIDSIKHAFVIDKINPEEIIIKQENV